MADPNLPAGRPNRTWRVVLVISLGLNLAVVGMVVGSALSGRLGDGPPRSFDLGVGPLARALSPDERHAIGRELRQDGAFRRMDLRGRVAGVVETLRAEPFDPDALRGLLSEQAAHVATVQQQAQDATINQIIAMTPERRRAFADQLVQEMMRERPPRDKPSGG